MIFCPWLSLTTSGCFISHTSKRGWEEMYKNLYYNNYQYHFRLQSLNFQDKKGSIKLASDGKTPRNTYGIQMLHNRAEGCCCPAQARVCTLQWRRAQPRGWVAWCSSVPWAPTLDQISLWARSSLHTIGCQPILYNNASRIGHSLPVSNKTMLRKEYNVAGGTIWLGVMPSLQLS